MNTRTFFLTLASVTLLAACAQQAPEPAPVPDTTADEAAWHAGLDAFVTAWNTSDTVAYGATIAADAIAMPQGQEALAGRDAIVAAMSSGFDINMAQQSITMDEVVIIGDYASAYGTWQLNPTEAPGPDTPVITGKWMSLHRRTADGGWEMWRWMWNYTIGPPLPVA